MTKQLLKVKLTENDINKIIHSVLFNLKESFDNPFTIPEKLRNNLLMEGYFKTYPAEDILKYLSNRYGEYASIQLLENKNGVKVFSISFYNDKDNENVINKDMALCGYFPSISQVEGNIKHIQYEPKFQNNVNNIVQKEEYIFHLTPSNKVNKILNIGLTPKTNNKLFNYPDRVYFFLHKPSKKDCLLLMKQFYIEKSQIKNQLQYKGSYSLLSVKTKMIKNCNFSYDPNAFDAIYTYDNIPPEAIKVVCEIEQEYLK